MRSYSEILDENLHGTPVAEHSEARARVPVERDPLDILASIRKPKTLVFLGGAAAVVAGVVVGSFSPNSGGNAINSEPDTPQASASQSARQAPTPGASAGGDIFETGPKHINVSFAGIDTEDGCVTNVVSFANQKIKTKPLMAYQREIEILSLQVTTKTCIDENARFFRVEGTPDEQAGIVPLTVGLDATSIRTSTEITNAQLKMRTVLPGENLSATACKQIPVAGCPQNPNAPKGVNLDPTAEKAIIATLEVEALHELQQVCAAPIYKTATQIPAQVFSEQLTQQEIPSSYLTFQMVDKNNKPLGNVPNYEAAPLPQLKNSGAAVKSAQQAVIFGNTKPVIKDCGVTNG